MAILPQHPALKRGISTGMVEIITSIFTIPYQRDAVGLFCSRKKMVNLNQQCQRINKEEVM